MHSLVHRVAVKQVVQSNGGNNVILFSMRDFRDYIILDAVT